MMNGNHGSIYRTMLENMQEAILLCRALEDSGGKLLDYEILEINKSMLELLNLKQGDIRLRRFSEAASLNKNSFLYFSELTKKLTGLGDSATYELYDPSLSKWQFVSIYPEGEKNYTILIKDITENKLYNGFRGRCNDAVELLCITDFAGKLIRYNATFEKVLGFSPKRLETLSLWEILYDSKRNRITYINQEILSSKRLLRIEAQCLKKEQDFIWLQLSIYPDSESNLVYIVARDITNRKNIEEQLRESEERWQFALEGSEAGVWDWNIETGEQKYSKGWKRMLGYEDHEIQSNIEEWLSRVHPEDYERAKQTVEDYITGAIPNYNFEHRLRCKGGNYRWILSRAKIVKRNRDGKPLRMTGTHTDITELKLLVEGLTELTSDYEIIFNGTQDAMFLISVDEDGKLRYNRLNSSHERLTCYTTEQVKGRTPQEVFGKKLGRKLEANYYRCIKKQHEIQYEEEVELLTGPRVWCTRLSPFIRNGKVTYIVGSSRDITEQKSIEAYKNKADTEIKLLNESIAYENMKTEFFSNLSHELRTPLNVILCSLQLINLLVENNGNQELKTSISRYMEIMKQNSYRLLRLVNNLIDITKADSGYVNLIFKNTDIVSMVEDVVMSIETYVQSKSIKLYFLSEVKKRIIAIDMDKIERVILNLLSNAVKFTDAGGEIHVKLYEKSNMFYVSVKDSGIGIPKEKLEIIFNRFIQVDKSMTRRQEGSGIGLTLVKSLVELHDGEVTVRSELGKGSEFIIQLPIYCIENEEIVDYSESKTEIDVRELINIEFSDLYS